MRGFEKLHVPRQLIGTDKTDHGFRLWPPMLVSVDDTNRARLIDQCSIPVESLGKHRLSHFDGGRAHARKQCLITERLCGLAKQPASLDVVTKRDSIRFDLPIVVKEQT